LQQNQFVVQNADMTSSFRVTNLVTATIGPPLALFVYDVPDDTFSHIASIIDIESYPESRNDALSAGLEFYRRPDVQKDFQSLSDATSFAEGVRGQLEALAQIYGDVEDEFIANTQYVFTNEV
jgi:hypothetical protein